MKKVADAFDRYLLELRKSRLETGPFSLRRYRAAASGRALVATEPAKGI